MSGYARMCGGRLAVLPLQSFQTRARNPVSPVWTTLHFAFFLLGGACSLPLTMDAPACTETNQPPTTNHQPEASEHKRGNGRGPRACPEQEVIDIVIVVLDTDERTHEPRPRGHQRRVQHAVVHDGTAWAAGCVKGLSQTAQHGAAQSRFNTR